MKTVVGHKMNGGILYYILFYLRTFLFTSGESEFQWMGRIEFRSLFVATNFRSQI